MRLRVRIKGRNHHNTYERKRSGAQGTIANDVCEWQIWEKVRVRRASTHACARIIKLAQKCIALGDEVHHLLRSHRPRHSPGHFHAHSTHIISHNKKKRKVILGVQRITLKMFHRPPKNAANPNIVFTQLRGWLLCFKLMCPWIEIDHIW